MSRSARVSLFFFEGDFDFQLRVKELILLEETRLAKLKPLFPAMRPEEVSNGAIHERLGSGMALIDDIRHVLRLGLVGAGMKPEEAHDLVERHLVAGQVEECASIAHAVLGVARYGVREDAIGDNLGEREGAAEDRAPPPPATRDGPTSSEPAPLPSNGRRGKSKNSASGK